MTGRLLPPRKRAQAPRPAVHSPNGAPHAGSLVLTIATIGAAGDGIGLAPNGQRVFEPLTLPGEQVQVVPLAPRGGGLAARLERILVASPDRLAPPCPQFGACGGCVLQHWQAVPYLEWKADLLRAALTRAGFAAPSVAPTVATPPAARRRMDLALWRAGADLRVGLHRLRGTEVVDLAACAGAAPDPGRADRAVAGAAAQCHGLAARGRGGGEPARCRSRPAAADRCGAVPGGPPAPDGVRPRARVGADQLGTRERRAGADRRPARPGRHLLRGGGRAAARRLPAGLGRRGSGDRRRRARGPADTPAVATRGSSNSTPAAAR